MKNKIITRFSIFIATMALLIFSAAPAFAVTNSTSVVSPYWQSDSTSYTFIAVSHPSLSNMASQVGVELNAIQSDLSAFNTAVSLTVSAGKTERVFIVRTGHSIVNSTIIPSGFFIVGTTNYKYGNIIIRNVASHPYNHVGGVAGLPSDGAGYRDVTMLSFFGGIVFDSTTTGFAMEFIGDTQDSTTTYDWNQTATSGVN